MICTAPGRLSVVRSRVTAFREKCLANKLMKRAGGICWSSLDDTIESNIETMIINVHLMIM